MSSLSWDLFARFPKEIEQLFARRGLTKAVDILAFYPITVLGGIGVILNVISIVVNEKLQRDFSAIAFFKFLRVYLINSALMCLILMSNFVGYSMRTYPWVMSEKALQFYIHFFVVFTNICYFYSTVLNILITLERIWTLRGGRQFFTAKNVRYVCVVALIAVLIVDIPLYMYSRASSRIIFMHTFNQNGTIQSSHPIIWWTAGFTPFSASQAGKTIQICLNVFRDGILVLVEIIVSILSIYYLSVYLDKKKKIAGGGGQGASRTNKITTQPMSQSNNTNNSGGATTTANGGTSRVKSGDRAQANMTLMTFCICFLSFLEHATVTASLLLPYTSSFSPRNYSIVSCTVCLVSAFKHASNFVIMLVFNSKFREHFLKMIKC